MQTSASLTANFDARRSIAGAREVRRLFTIEFLSSCASNFLQTGIFFYTGYRFGWTLRDNFLLAAAQGAMYVIGAMNAHRLTRLWPRRGALVRTFSAMMLIGMLGAMFPYSKVLAVLLVSYSGLAAMSWPILESLVSDGLESDALSRRISIYNLMWASSGAMVVALNGIVIEHFPGGVFALPAIFHGVGMMLTFQSSKQHDDPPVSTVHAASVPIAPELLRLRTAALWLSRVALPATYVLIYSLMALMPSLPVMRSLSPAKQTLVGSAWMISRMLVFILLGASSWWHTRPRILIIAAIVMLLAFAGTVIRPSQLLSGVGPAMDVVSMVCWQTILGIVLGMIYAASLYFGMVLSQGSTEHGGYHEALIGLGSILGPGAGAIAATLSPGNVQAGIFAVGGVIAVSVVAVVVTGWVHRAGRTTQDVQVSSC